MQDTSLIPRLGRSPGERNGNPLQYSCLENPKNRRAWRAPRHRVAESGRTEQLTLSLSGRQWLNIDFFFKSQCLLPNMFVLRNKVTFKFKGHNCLREALGPFPLGWALGIGIRNPQFPATQTSSGPQAAGLDPAHPRMQSSWLLQAGPTLT